MKIAFIRHSILNRGGDRMVLEYAGYLAQKGHEVTIWVNYIHTIFTISPLIKINYLSLKSKTGTIVKVIFSRFPSDIIIADIIAMVSFLSFRNRKKLIYFAQDYDESYYSSPLMRWLVRVLYFYALTLRHVPAIAVSPQLGILFDSRFKARVKVVPNGISFAEFYSDRDNELLREKGDKKAVIVFMRSDYRKGSDISLKVLQKIAGTEFKDGILVWIIGEDAETPLLANKKFGFVKHDMLRKLLSSADIFLYPTRHEGLPLFVLEALACGCPIVTTFAAGIVENDKDALVSPVEDVDDLSKKLIQLVSDEGLRNRLKNEGFKTAEKYDLNKSKRDFEENIINLT